MTAALALDGERICSLCGVPFTPEHFVNDPRHAMRWWTRYAVGHLRAARLCLNPHAGKPCRAWHLGQAVQGRAYARELRRRHGF